MSVHDRWHGAKVKVYFHTPAGVPEQFDETVEMPAIPREGDTVDFGDGDIDQSYRVHHVMWTPNEPDYDAYVVLR